MQTSRRRGPGGRFPARACAWQVGNEGGERGRCTWVPVGRGRRCDEQSLLRSPDDADASTAKAMEQRNGERFHPHKRAPVQRRALQGQEKNTRTSTHPLENI